MPHPLQEVESGSRVQRYQDRNVETLNEGSCPRDPRTVCGSEVYCRQQQMLMNFDGYVE